MALPPLKHTPHEQPPDHITEVPVGSRGGDRDVEFPDGTGTPPPDGTRETYHPEDEKTGGTGTSGGEISGGSYNGEVSGGTPPPDDGSREPPSYGKPGTMPFLPPVSCAALTVSNCTEKPTNGPDERTPGSPDTHTPGSPEPGQPGSPDLGKSDRDHGTPGTPEFGKSDRSPRSDGTHMPGPTCLRAETHQHMKRFGGGGLVWCRGCVCALLSLTAFNGYAPRGLSVCRSLAVRCPGRC